MAPPMSDSAPLLRLLCVAAAVVAVAEGAQPPKKNVLFFVSDDFRPDTGAYGNPFASTPNLDKLAEEGLLFRAAHVQFAYCAPSRNSFMSGRRPDTNHVYNFLDDFRDPQVGGDKWTSLPEHFKNNGYLVTGSGKVFHPGLPKNFDQPRSWSAEDPSGVSWPYNDSPVPGPNASTRCNHSDPDTFYDDDHYCLTKDFNNAPAGEREYLLDEAVTNEVIGRLNIAIDNWKATKQPFFVAMGTHRPHLPWVYPKRFYDRIPKEVPEAAHKFWPADVPHLGFHECAEMSVNYLDSNGEGTAFSDTTFSGHQAQMRRAYYGALSYTDDLIGQALNALKAGGADNDTVVSWLGDHGWMLGEHDMWCKMSTLELATRIPLIIRAPWIKTAVNATTRALVEAVDIYPTIVELAGLSLPTGAGGEHLGGVSLLPLFTDPARGSVKNATLSQFPRCWQNNTHFEQQNKPGDENNRTSSWESMSDCHWTERKYLDFMGYKMRTHNMSITQWVAWNGTELRADWSRPVGTELYSHVGDNGLMPSAFDDFENINLADDPRFAAVKVDMLAQLKDLVAQWNIPIATPQPVVHDLSV